jgi:uncharacterized repeat protein (TIGR01451 family)
MFEKLLANLPYNPSLVHQLGFYAKRMRREESIRRTGVVFLVLAFMVQFFAVISPPQPTVAYSTNDMINGGFTRQAEAVTACKNNSKSYGAVLADFGISCEAVAKATVVAALRSTSYDKKLYSMGWLHEDTSKTTGKPTGEIQLRDLSNVPASDLPLYARYLWSWDTGSYSDYKALKVTASTGKTYFILFGCGNLVSIGQPVPVPKTTTPPTAFAYPQCGGLTVKQTAGRAYSFNTSLTNPAGSFIVKSYTFDFGDSQSTTVNTAASSAGASHTYANDGNYTIKTTASGSLKYPDGRTSIYWVTCQANLTVSTTITPTTPVTPVTTMCQYNPALPADSPDCKACDKGSQQLLDCMVLSKAAANQTKGIASADGTQAAAGDTIVYTLTAKNTSKTTVPQFVMQENLSDVLDYATVKDLDGGTIDNNSLVTWPAKDVAAGNSISHTITVQVKLPIPNTPPDPSDPAHFDHVMTNLYGNSVNITLPSSVVTTAITASATLPNTGPGSSLVLIGAITIVAGYFFARARLLADESMIAVRQTSNHGGM